MGFYNSLTFMLSFMVLLVFANMAFGSKFTEKFLLLVLASMLVFNADKLTEISKGLSSTGSGGKASKTGGGGHSGGTAGGGSR